MPDFAEFFALSRHGVFRAVLAATGNRASAEDAVAEAYARAYVRWATVSAHANPTAWVLRTALNAHRSMWRRSRRETLAESPPDVAVAHAQSGLDAQVREAVRALPRRQREVVALRLVADLSAEETGALLGMAPSTVHVHLHRALAELRKRLEPTSGSGDDRRRPSAAVDHRHSLDVIDFAMVAAVQGAY
jgi:RNA polymerase sigma-70 factor (ECF subfamily)